MDGAGASGPHPARDRTTARPSPRCARTESWTSAARRPGADGLREPVHHGGREQEQRRLPGDGQGEEHREPGSVPANGQQQATHGGEGDDRAGRPQHGAVVGDLVPRRRAVREHVVLERHLVPTQPTVRQHARHQDAETEENRLHQHGGAEHQGHERGHRPRAGTGHDARSPPSLTARPCHSTPRRGARATVHLGAFSRRGEPAGSSAQPRSEKRQPTGSGRPSLGP